MNLNLLKSNTLDYNDQYYIKEQMLSVNPNGTKLKKILSEKAKVSEDSIELEWFNEYPVGISLKVNKEPIYPTVEDMENAQIEIVQIDRNKLEYLWENVNRSNFLITSDEGFKDFKRFFESEFNHPCLDLKATPYRDGDRVVSLLNFNYFGYVFQLLKLDISKLINNKPYDVFNCKVATVYDVENTDLRELSDEVDIIVYM